MDKAYVIIVNYRSWKDTIECIESVLKIQYEKFQVLLVDNSEDNVSCENFNRWAGGGYEVETRYKDIVYPLVSKPFESYRILSEKELSAGHFDEKLLIIKAEKNAGFSAANNIGLQYALRCQDFGFAWLLNNDTVVLPDSLSQQVGYMNQSNTRGVGILGAKVMNYYGDETVQSAGGGKLIKPLAYSLLVGAGQIDNKQFDVDRLSIDFVAGTSMFVRSEFLSQVGLLSEDYFLYFEEPDWFERGRVFKWEMGYCYKCKVYHKGGATTGGQGYSITKTSTIASDFYFQRAKLLFTKKYYWYWLPTVYLSFLFVIFNRLRRRQWDRIKILFFMALNPRSKNYRQT